VDVTTRRGGQRTHARGSGDGGGGWGRGGGGETQQSSQGYNGGGTGVDGQWGGKGKMRGWQMMQGDWEADNTMRGWGRQFKTIDAIACDHMQLHAMSHTLLQLCAILQHLSCNHI
jgi:hypothetical protein